MSRILGIVAILGATFAWAPDGAACAARAQEGSPARAGIIVEWDDRREEYCVPVDEAGVALIDALGRTGLDLVVQDHGADQLTLCRIGEVGCPRDDCFCACAQTDDGCTFWGVYELADDGWSFSQAGIGEVMVRPGDVIGLRWDVQTPDGGAAPRASDPRAVCRRVSAAGARAEPEPAAGSGPGWVPPVVIAAIAAALGGAWGMRRRGAGAAE